MNKKKLNKVISLALMALFANSSCSANINVETGVVSGGRTIKNAMLGNGKMQNSVRPKCSSEELAPSCSGSTLTDSSLVAVSSIILGLTAVGSVGIAKYNEWGPFAPNKPGTPSETPDEGEPAPKVETPKFVDMYQQARFVLGQPCLRDYAIAYLNNGVDLCKRSYPGSYYPLYLGFNGDFVAFEDLDTMKKKAFLVNPSDALIHAFLKGFHHEEEAQEAVEAWNEQNKNHDAGEKYNILVKLIGLPIDTEKDIYDLADVLRAANIVNENECMTLGVTTYNNRQNRICVAMFGYSENRSSYKKIVTSCQKGLHLDFDKTFYTCGTSNTEGEETKRYYFITPTSVEKCKPY